jgi:hydroxymethylpyrimidine pyrophosphatase-like HAD family hydrolase
MDNYWRDLSIPAGLSSAIQAFQARGGQSYDCNWRTVRTTTPFAEELGVDGPLICYQGALVQDHRNRQGFIP